MRILYGNSTQKECSGFSYVELAERIRASSENFSRTYERRLCAANTYIQIYQQKFTLKNLLEKKKVPHAVKSEAQHGLSQSMGCTCFSWLTKRDALFLLLNVSRFIGHDNKQVHPFIKPWFYRLTGGTGALENDPHQRWTDVCQHLHCHLGYLRGEGFNTSVAKRGRGYKRKNGTIRNFTTYLNIKCYRTCFNMPITSFHYS